MKLTKKALALLKEADKVAPLLSKECVVCKHHNPNHLLLTREEDGYKIICKQCSNPKKEDFLTDSKVAIPFEEKTNENIEFKANVDKIKLEKIKKIKKVVKSKKIIKSINENLVVSNLPVTEWNLAYGPTPKGFMGNVWLAESPDPIPSKVYTDENGVMCKIYYFKTM